MGPIIIPMTISLDGGICSKSRILSLFVNIEVLEASCVELFIAYIYRSLLNADLLCHGMV